MSECDIKCIENQTKVDDAECDYGFVYDTDVYGETTITQVNSVKKVNFYGVTVYCSCLSLFDIAAFPKLFFYKTLQGF